MTPETRNKKLAQLKRIEKQGLDLQIKLDRKRNKWEDLKDELNNDLTKNNIDDVEPIEYDFHDILC